MTEPQEYIITEELLCRMAHEDDALKWHYLLKEVRSRPILADVLDELEQWCKPEDNELDRPAKYKGDFIHPSGRLLKKIEELRTKQQGGRG